VNGRSTALISTIRSFDDEVQPIATIELDVLVAEGPASISLIESRY
jgi:hypothetical protein